MNIIAAYNRYQVAPKRHCDLINIGLGLVFSILITRWCFFNHNDVLGDLMTIIIYSFLFQEVCINSDNVHGCLEIPYL